MSPTLGHREFYNIGQPYTNGRCIVYGDGEMGWYDYVLIDSQGLTETRSNLQYGSPEIALRDALIKASKGQAMRDPHDRNTSDLVPAKRGRPCLDSERGPMTPAELQRFPALAAQQQGGA